MLAILPGPINRSKNYIFEVYFHTINLPVHLIMHSELNIYNQGWPCFRGGFVKYVGTTERPHLRGSDQYTIHSDCIEK